jgi:hypothetical protein
MKTVQTLRTTAIKGMGAKVAILEAFLIDKRSLINSLI